MHKPRPQVEVPSSGQFDFIYGRYDLSQWRVPYFATTMTLRQAAASLRLVNDFPGAEGLAWKIDELYQRDINWTRVERQIVPYLRGETQPQFFNSLTVALLPILDNQLKTSFDGNAWAPAPLIDPEGFAQTKVRGPIRLGYWQPWQTLDDPGCKLGQIRWNTSQVFSVAIDGQHRLAAIKQFASAIYDDRLDRTHIPVILILLDPELGYRAPEGKPLVDVLRIIFIDLNKHAQQVTRSRQILLDDKDPYSLCVRALVGRQILEGDTELTQLPPRLPLSLVDWHSESAKFDEGPYGATILGLDWMVTTVFGPPPIRDYTDYRGIRRQIRAISQQLGLPLAAAYQRLTQLEQGLFAPFYYTGGDAYEGAPSGELGEIVDAFRQVWAPPLVFLLTKYAPYQTLIGTRNEIGALTVEFVNWYYLYKRMKDDKFDGIATAEYNRFVAGLSARPQRPLGAGALEEKLREIEEAKGDSLAFKVVFQRALMHGFLELQKIEEEDIGLPHDEEEEDQPLDEEDATEREPLPGTPASEKASRLMRRMTQYVESLNTLLERGPRFLDHKLTYSGRDGEHTFWLGSLVDASGIIDFTLGASKRAGDLAFLAAALDLCRRTNDETLQQGFDSFWETLGESEESIHKRIRRAIKRFSAERGAGGRILAGREEKYSEDRAEVECRARLQWLWEHLGLPGVRAHRK